MQRLRARVRRDNARLRCAIALLTLKVDITGARKTKSDVREDNRLADKLRAQVVSDSRILKIGQRIAPTLSREARGVLQTMLPALRTYYPMTGKHPYGIPSLTGWVPVAGRDMPDIETNPGPHFARSLSVFAIAGICAALYLWPTSRDSLPDMTQCWLIRPGLSSTVITPLDGSCKYTIPARVLRVIALENLPGSSALVWRVGNNRCFKISDHPGYYSLPVADFDDIIMRFGNSGIANCNSIARRLKELQPNIDAFRIANILLTILGGPKGKRAIQYFTQPTTIGSENPHEHVKVGYVSECGPALVDTPAVYPGRGHSSSLAAVLHRIYAVNPGVLSPPPWLNGYIEEFVGFMLPDTLLDPYSEAEVLAEQSTAKTHVRMTEAILQDVPADEKSYVTAFIKGEAYPSPKDMRNISGVNPEHNLHGFRFGLPFKHHVLERQHWYAPCLTPSELTQRLASVVVGHDVLVEGDFSRYDGRQTRLVRNIPFQIMARCFERQHRHEFWSMINSHFDATCKTSEGVPYDTCGSMLSGAWCTTDANTILDAFLRYAALRQAGIAPRDAYNNLGLFFGDDSLGPYFDNLEHTAPDVARQLGLKLEIEVRHHGFFTFLSRFYSYNPQGITGSCVDLARLVGKLTSIPRSPVTSFDWQSKFSSILLLAGPHTPIISSYCRSWLRLHGLSVLGYRDIPDDMLPYWMQQNDFGAGFPSLDDVALEASLDSLCQLYGTTEEAIYLLDSKIKEVTTLDELFALYLQTDESETPDQFGLVGCEFTQSQPGLFRRPPRK